MKLPFELDENAAPSAAFGLVILQADETTEMELRSVLAHPGMALHHTRLPSAPDVTTETLKQMEHELPRAISLLPDARGLDVVAYACTSGATIIGTEKVAKMVRAYQPNAKTTDPMTAVIAALRHIGISRIGVLTPYLPEVSLQIQNHMRENGFEINAFGSFEQEIEATVVRINAASVLDAISVLGNSDDVDAVFVSCTNLRSFGVIEEAEKRIGKPVVSSNLAMAWHMLTLAGIPTDGKYPSRLFSTPLSGDRSGS